MGRRHENTAHNMSHVAHIVKNTFINVFQNLSKELGMMVESIQLGIYYDQGQQKYTAYRNFKPIMKTKEGVMRKENEPTAADDKIWTFDIGSYVGMIIDFSGGTQMIETTLAQAGAGYANKEKCGTDDIKIIMQYKKDSLPDAVLMKGGDKVRAIDIRTEFLS